MSLICVKFIVWGLFIRNFVVTRVWVLCDYLWLRSVVTRSPTEFHRPARIIRSGGKDKRHMTGVEQVIQAETVKVVGRDNDKKLHSLNLKQATIF